MFGKNSKVVGLVMVSVFDSVSGKFGTPVTIDNDASAIRAFCDMVNNKDTIIGQHPADFKLYKVGYFNPDTGEIYSKFDKDADVLCTGLEALAMKGDENA